MPRVTPMDARSELSALQEGYYSKAPIRSIKYLAQTLSMPHASGLQRSMPRMVDRVKNEAIQREVNQRRLNGRGLNGRFSNGHIINRHSSRTRRTISHRNENHRNASRRNGRHGNGRTISRRNA